MDRSQSPISQARRPKKPKSGISTTELVIWSVATLVVSLFIFGAIAAIPLAPQLASMLSPSRTPTMTLTGLPTSVPTETVAGAAPTETGVTALLAPATTQAPTTPDSTQDASPTGPASLTPAASSSLPPGTQRSATTASPTTSSSSSPASATATLNPAATPSRTPSPTRTPRDFVPSVTPIWTASATSDFVPPTATNTSIPTTSPDGWTILNIRLHPDSEANSLTVYGEVVNNTGETQEIVNIVGTFFDAEDNMIANPNDTSDFTPTDILPNGGSTPFELIVTSPTENVLNPDHYTLEVRSEPNSETPRIVPATDFTVQSQFTEFDEYCLTVNYQNTGGEFEEYLTLAAVLFDANGKVISLSDPYEPDLEEVAGGLVHEFDICIDPLGVDLTGARHEFRGWGR